VVYFLFFILLHGTVPIVWYIFVFYIIVWNCSDSVVYFLFFILLYGTVPIVWYIFVFHIIVWNCSDSVVYFLSFILLYGTVPIVWYIFVFHFITIFSNLIRWNGILFIISCNIQGPDTPGFWWGLCCSCFYFSVLNFVLFVIVLCLVSLLLSVSLDCQFFMVLSGFSDDYLLKVSY
jgi:hypothetical protein